MSPSTVAVSFTDGTVMTVAKIEGSKAYQDEMLRILYTAPGRFIDESPPLISENGGVRELTFEERSHPIPPPPPEDNSRISNFLDTMYHYYRWYAPWVRFTITKTPLEKMLQDLKTSAEDFLGYQIKVVEVSVPLRLDVGTNQRHFDLDVALHRIGLTRSRQYPETAAIAAIQGNEGSNGSYLLCIDYSLSGLIVTALVDHVGGREVGIHRVIYRPDLGAGFQDTTPDFWDQVRREIQRSLENWDYDVVLHYVLIGDMAASEPRLWDIINSMWVFRSNHDDILQEDKSKIDYVDPVYAAAIGMAKMGQSSMAMDEPEAMAYSEANKMIHSEENSREL